MQHRYEHWSSESEIEHQVSEEPPIQTAEQAFPFVEDLKVLEESMSLNLTEGLAAYREHQGLRSLKTAGLHTPEAPDWDDLAKQVADHVVSYLAETTGLSEAEHWQARNDALYEDNRAMAEHVQRLVEENELLRNSVSVCELELAHFRHLLGNLYLKL